MSSRDTYRITGRFAAYLTKFVVVHKQGIDMFGHIVLTAEGTARGLYTGSLQTHGKVGKQRQTVSQSDRQTDRQTDRQADTQTDRQNSCTQPCVQSARVRHPCVGL